MIQVSDWQIDDWNCGHITRRVPLRQIEELLSNPYIVVANRGGRTGTHLLIGRDHGGACIAVPMLPTVETDVWRPISAWYCKPDEAARLHRRGR